MAVLYPTKEMEELRKIFVPYYEKGYVLSATAPQKVKEAYDKYMKLFDEQWELEESLM